MAFPRFGRDELVAAQDPIDRRPRELDPVVMFEVPHDRVGPGVEARFGERAAELDDQLDRRWWGRGRAGVRSS